ncbi:uncharacterized protein UV8b_06991 [Ustilaginoidea virens]|uniref:Beta-xylanase n=1 Tax=Ustilaginoidea virens TaxID=1159556 RepID=A0A063CDU7_USTVR|nr:uncharacterized protein UV8b_06991 [Ustilaginoidea virens]QUC22750.1 hypothetical protein UV8b_06991 [Ustilaginoidea virens]GAO16503.1 hypothetical protein UVI_02010900 [Ustilaginoidea virens]
MLVCFFTAVLAAGSVVALPARRADAVSLDAKFGRDGKRYWGVATDRDRMSPQAVAVIQSQFGQVTPENSMKWENTEPQPGQFRFADADALVYWAQRNGKLVRGHALLWHAQLAAWVHGISDRETLTRAIQNHIARLVGRYRGKIYAWDVCNEILNEDGSMRQSVFYKVLGEDFVRIAFEAAHRADPNAKLYINDFNLDAPDGAKTRAMVSRVQRWRAQGIPIHGIGSQMHLRTGQGPATAAALRALGEAAPEVAVTELDVAFASPADYVAVARGCVAVSNCVGVTSWGVGDGLSWRGREYPLLFDGSYRPKAAYEAVMNAL